MKNPYKWPDFHGFPWGFLTQLIGEKWVSLGFLNPTYRGCNPIYNWILIDLPKLPGYYGTHQLESIGFGTRQFYKILMDSVLLPGGTFIG